MYANLGSDSQTAARRGTKFKGLAHLSDIYLTVAVGIAQLSVDIASTGPIPPDSHNLWPALMGGTASPRSEVIHDSASPARGSLAPLVLLWQQP